MTQLDYCEHTNQAFANVHCRRPFMPAFHSYAVDIDALDLLQSLQSIQTDYRGMHFNSKTKETNGKQTAKRELHNKAENVNPTQLTAVRSHCRLFGVI